LLPFILPLLLDGVELLVARDNDNLCASNEGELLADGLGGATFFFCVDLCTPPALGSLGETSGLDVIDGVFECALMAMPGE